MNDRNKEILTDIRRNLNQLSQQTLRDGQLFNDCNRIQKRIMFVTHCIERQFKIVLKPGKEDYDILNEKIIKINKWFTSWDYDILYKDNYEWEKYRQLSGTRPEYMTIFGGKIYFSPIPTLSGDTVSIWANQIGVITPMDNDTEPELQEICDEALVYGVCQLYDKAKFIDDFNRELALITSQIHHKSSRNQNGSNW